MSYKHDPSTGAVSKDGVIVGIISDGVLTTPTPLAGPTKGTIRKALGMDELKFFFNEDKEPAKAEEDESTDPQPDCEAQPVVKVQVPEPGTVEWAATFFSI